ncbi:MAG: hypothetical protein H7141_12215 [Burkholderiales bacterium]|nr:hypothetical protein [Bacteroidia bacterium]
MKHLYLILFLVLSVAIYSQAAPSPKIKITKSHFLKAKTLRDLLPSLPKNCPITEYQFAIDTPQLRKTLTIKNNKITSDVKSIVKNMKTGQKIFIESIKSNCKTPFKKKHIFVLT